MNSAVEMVTVPESRASSLELNLTRDDGSENEESIETKISMKNILYEPGIKHYACIQLHGLSYIHIRHCYSKH